MALHMKDYSYCCSADGHGLRYEGFSVVFIQTFSIHHNLVFCVPEEFVQITELEKASAYNKPMLYMKQNIENQIFISNPDESEEFPRLLRFPDKSGVGRIRKLHFGLSGKDAVPVVEFPQDRVFRFSMKGFDFELPVISEDDENDQVLLSGHVNVEMSLFFGQTVSITYRFLFDGDAAKVTDMLTGLNTNASTDHVIALLSTFLGAEYWSKEKVSGSDPLASQTDINLETVLTLKGFCFDEKGNLLDTPLEKCVLAGKGRTFDYVCNVYKQFIYSNCTAFKPGLDKSDERDYLRRRSGHSVINDLHYGLVDIWENVHHYDEDENDLFEQKVKGGLSDAAVIDHIRDFHKPELIGLMTLYPGEWPFRCASDYDDVCGGNIAIDTDDLVLAGKNLAVVIGTYGRRGSDAKVVSEDDITSGVDWSEHLKERRRYHVSWPEYLLILQMVLAKKYRINLAKDQLVGVTVSAKELSAEELIGKNAELSMRLSRMILQLDVVKYSKFASHVVMFDRTTERLGLEKDMEQLRNIIEMVDGSLQNLSEYKSMKSEFFLNIILAIISVVSTFELMFQNSELPFLTYFNIESGGLAAWVVMVVTSVAVFALLLTIKNSVRRAWDLFIKK